MDANLAANLEFALADKPARTLRRTPVLADSALLAPALSAVLAPASPAPPASASSSAAPEPPPVLFIRTLTGKTITMTFTEDMTIDMLKRRIQDREGIPPDQQLIVIPDFGHRTEGTKWLIADYNVYPGRIISLVLKLAGD